MQFTVQRGALASAKDEAVVVALFQGAAKLQGAAKDIDAATGGLLTKLLGGDFKAKRADTIVLYPSGLAAERLLLVGLGKKEQFGPDAVRIASAAAAKRLNGLKVRSYTTTLLGVGTRGVGPEEAAQALVEGAELALYKFDKYRTPEEEEAEEAKRTEAAEKERLAPKLKAPKVVERITILLEDGRMAKQAERGVATAKVIAESVNFTRDLVNESAKDGTPAAIATRVQDMAKQVGLKCDIYGRKELEKMGFGALLAVNQGSSNEARFVVLEHNPKGKETLVFVGKGITFDSGGISIKPSANMEKMKYDKSGASAVFGALRAAALLGVPQRVVGLCPLTDNVPDGNSYKPGDVVRAYNGKWIEVINTDAEGRVVLSDALAYASKNYKPTAVIDLATLTGACGVALGNLYIGAMATDRALMAKVRRAGEASHERVWELPFDEEYDDYFKSDIADAKNAGTGQAGTIVGGRFLKRFVDGAPWVHLDIASTAWDEGSGRAKFNPEYNIAGSGTGVGVRLLVQLMRDWKSGGRNGR
ncbi:MAG TPA: leucyl aminopeptidase [Candidatus Thermoplasmatota archaeon]|jgi:leucyl aminopeptidase|nr:leucyl aminopeptidase [Candidatus Thermoplasmatota archaeon]